MMDESRVRQIAEAEAHKKVNGCSEIALMLIIWLAIGIIGMVGIAKLNNLFLRVGQLETQVKQLELRAKQ